MIKSFPALTSWLSWLEHHLMHLKVAGSVSGQGTYIPRLWVWSPVGVRMRVNQLMFLSLEPIKTYPRVKILKKFSWIPGHGHQKDLSETWVILLRSWAVCYQSRVYFFSFSITTVWLSFWSHKLRSCTWRWGGSVLRRSRCSQNQSFWETVMT